MPYDSGGAYSLPSPQAFPALEATISSTDYKTVLADLGSALNLAFLRNGAAQMSGNLNLGGNQITNGVFAGSSVQAVGAVQAGPSALHSFNTDTTTGFGRIANGVMSFKSQGTEVMTVGYASSGGVAARNVPLSIFDTLNASLRLYANSSLVGEVTGTSARLQIESYLSSLRLRVGGIDGYNFSTYKFSTDDGTAGWAAASSKVNITTNNLGANGHGLSVWLNHNDAGYAAANWRITQTGQALMQFFYGGAPTNVGSITTNGTTTTYGTTSDARAKKDIEPLADPWKILTKVQPRSFRWRSTDKLDVGFIAQELEAVVPEAVHVPSDPSVWMSVDAGKLMPYVIAALQDLHQRIRKPKR